MISEIEVIGFYFWNRVEQTYNVTGAASVPSPVLKYLTGLRYSTRYEYVASAEFPNFMETERALQIEREVVFTCSDGNTRQYKFIFPVEDENTNAVRNTH